jgi:hypothetical protein
MESFVNRLAQFPREVSKRIVFNGEPAASSGREAQFCFCVFLAGSKNHKHDDSFEFCC